ncbi:hypothetical protein BWQ96_02212 [Gracilariopsis chorda]|uniref:Uncharacterized protein n=1 Tax=Gracilariopsis chorda TaxID=448386 RepID=A0A2V3J0U5_9FLOR|nr:hypothetical protein BWQ96_02212 [Gracilariopsis chorda]|eukprot:PXF48021.1 hypothetical protein BWQ96_02212 [Gracilariopsis chorda]
MAVLTNSNPFHPPALILRFGLLLLIFFLGYTFGKYTDHLYACLRPLRTPLRIDAQRYSAHPPQHEPRNLSSPQREIFLTPSAVRIEGIGAVLSGLKPILMLANYTNAKITMHDNFTGHGYNMTEYLRLEKPFEPHQRIPCKLNLNLRKFLVNVVEHCHNFRPEHLKPLRLFERCNSISVNKYIAHPRMCVKHTQDLARDFTKFQLRSNVRKDNLCVLRRGGDIEDIIRSGQGNMHAIDEQLTIPILRKAAGRGRRIVLATETRYEQEVSDLYRPHIFSNNESLPVVVSLLETCRCLFVSSGSAFAAAMMQLARPTYLVYTSSRPGFSFDAQWYHFDEYGEQAIDVTSGKDYVVERCAPQQL